ncbi:MAG: uridine kinase [Bryobacteraceae bacterium]
MSRKPYLIGIAGPSCSGKSEISRLFAATFQASLLSLDSYYRELSHLSLEDRTKVNFDSPESMDKDLIVAHLRQLASGNSIEKPRYDFAQFTPGDVLDHVPAADYVIVEGLFTLHWPEVHSLLHASVYISASHEICLERRLERDVRERGRTPEYVIAQYRDTVRPMCDRYIVPSAKYADLVLTGTNYLDQSVHCIVALIRSKPPVPLAEQSSIASYA